GHGEAGLIRPHGVAEGREGSGKAPGLGTLAVWAGETRPEGAYATQVPVVHSVSFGYRDLDQWLAVAQGRQPGHLYSRNTNPTVQAFEEKLRQLEGGEAATSFATGMGAITGTLLALVS